MRALTRLDQIHDHIALDNPTAALQQVQRLLRRVSQLSAFPHSGGKVADYDRDDVRELIEGSYRIVYRIEAKCLTVLTVKHCAQRLPPSVRSL